jgi:hypothetical protein
VKRPMLFPTNVLFSFAITRFTPSSAYRVSCGATQGRLFGASTPAEAVFAWVSNWWARSNIRPPPPASDAGISRKRVVM